MTDRLELAKKANPKLSTRQRSALLKICRSRLYYKPHPRDVSDDVDLMNEIRDIYQKRPYFGYIRMTDELNGERKEEGRINKKRTYRLMKTMGLQAVYPKKNLSKRRQDHAVYPYLMKKHPPQRPNDCWCVDITYIKTCIGNIYLSALIDAASRHIMGYSVSPTLDTSSVLDALEMALSSGHKPKMINSDQGCQFTAQEWGYSLALLEIQISMDGKGRWADNIHIERFWRTLKYEEVYLKSYDSVRDAKENLAVYIDWYNTQRRHSGIGQKRPIDVLMDNQGDGYVDNSNELPTSPHPQPVLAYLVGCRSLFGVYTSALDRQPQDFSRGGRLEDFLSSTFYINWS